MIYVNSPKGNCHKKISTSHDVLLIYVAIQSANKTKPANEFHLPCQNDKDLTQTNIGFLQGQLTSIALICFLLVVLPFGSTIQTTLTCVMSQRTYTQIFSLIGFFLENHRSFIKSNYQPATANDLHSLLHCLLTYCWWGIGLD